MIDKTLDFLKTYVSTTQVPPDQLPSLIQSVYAALTGLGVEVDRAPSSIDWQSTITDDYLICLEDNRKLKILKRHLQQQYGMTPEEYRKKWGLPADYPMVARSYGEARSRIAKAQGLGQRLTPQ